MLSECTNELLVTLTIVADIDKTQGSARMSETSLRPADRESGNRGSRPRRLPSSLSLASSRLPVSRKVGSREGMEKIGSERSPQHVYI